MHGVECNVIYFSSFSCFVNYFTSLEAIEKRAKYDKRVKYMSIQQNVIVRQLLYHQHVKTYKWCDVNKRKTCQNRIHSNFKRHFQLLNIWISINFQSRSVVRNWNKDKAITSISVKTRKYYYNRSSRPEVFREKGVLRIFAKFTEKRKRDSGTGIFQWILRNF